MKKLFIIASLLLVSAIFAQNSEQKVWNLLLSNKRIEARKLFDKDLKKSSKQNIDYLILDAILDMENGKIVFDESFAKDFASFPESYQYIPALLHKNLLLGDIEETGFDNFVYKKIDALYNSPYTSKSRAVVYQKGIAERQKRNTEEFKKALSKLNALNDWQFCGVFENLNDSGIDTEYEPELYAMNDKLFDANSNGKVGWYNPKIKHSEAYHMFLNEAEYGAGIVYSQTFIDNPSERNVFLNFGANSSIKLFLNDTEIYSNSKVQRTDIDAYKLKITLPVGTNRLLVKSSIASGSDYFSMIITDENGNSIPDLVYNDKYQNYKKSKIEEINPVEVAPDYEDYFIKKVQKNPDNFLNQWLLFQTYMHNKKFDLAIDVIDDLDKKYPASSLLKTCLANYYAFKNEAQQASEILKNIELNDPDYYLNIFMKLEDKDWLYSAEISELEKIKQKAASIQYPLYGYTIDFLIAAKKGNQTAMMEVLDKIIENSNNSEVYIATFAGLYDSIGNDRAKTLSLLEEVSKNYDSFQVIQQLARYYRNENKREDLYKIYKTRTDLYPYLISMRNDYVELLIEDKKYNEALSQIDISLSQFPFSFTQMQKKGLVYNLMNDEKNAEKFYRQSLSHDSGNSNLRKTLYSILNIEDELELVKTKDVYKIIKQRRNSKLKGDYGVTVLHDEYLINVLPEGGRKSKVTLVYEVTAENGIDELKEYSLNSYRNTILKAEIVKPDGSIVPAERGGQTLVFPNLAIGDVVYIDFESFDTSTGRFYKDFVVSNVFNGIYPFEESIFGIVYPNEIKFNSRVSNGEIASTTTKLTKNKSYTSWKKNKTQAMPLMEKFSPNYNDLTNIVEVGTIASWKEIANWYADLVKKNLHEDKITTNTFKQIFPQGTEGISEEEKAKKIYKYIEESITYSSLDFRQSGYVPQKPSKTIITKLGDCKDVSTLFVALANQAGLKSNLVLVLTNDNGTNTNRLPGIIFNHCIVKTEINGKDYFLELTNKYLPFKAMPSPLINANALVVSFDKAENEKATIISIPSTNALKNNFSTIMVVDIEDKGKRIKLQSKLSGNLKSYYNELFSNSITEEVRKKELTSDFNQRLKANVVVNSAKLSENDFFGNEISFDSDISISERLQSVGSLKIASLPFFENIYTRNIVDKETRNYDIVYSQYEDSNNYNSEIILNIPEGQKFSEIPETTSRQYKDHKYEILFELVKPNSLRIKRKASIPWVNVTKEEYPEFKKYVDDIIEIEAQIVGFK